ncbi:MAG: N-methyl-L-tryptophan oxidase [Thermoanaerobaculia bacterium]|nr:N-methyl-L-tryptophan oxidase [Thermoanaerobaculia bacterium]
MTHDYDCVVIGLGILGSSVAHHLAAAGARVLAVDRFSRSHDLGSSSGDTRIVQHLVFGGSAYTSLLHRALGAWNELEREADERLFFPKPALLVGPENSQLLSLALRGDSRDSKGLRVLGRPDLRRLHPGVSFTPSDIGVLDESAGLLWAHRCVETVQRLAKEHGAQLRFGVRAKVDWSRTTRNSARVRLQNDLASIEAGSVVIAAGSWVGQLLPRTLRRIFSVERIVQYWFEDDGFEDSEARPNHAQLTTLMLDRTNELHAVVPSLKQPHLHKVMSARGQSVFEQAEVERTVSISEQESIRRWHSRNFPDHPRTLKRFAVCTYTTTADDHFVIDHVPATSVVLASACCGRGFKVAPVLGRTIASMITTGRSPAELEPFRLQRPGLS